MIMQKEKGPCVNHLVVKVKDLLVSEFNLIERCQHDVEKYQQYLEKLQNIEKFN
jgi:hypothetical protein